MARRRQAPNVRRIGAPGDFARDLYHLILVQRWGGFYGILISLYLLANVVFATLYWLQPGGVAESDNSWGNAFYFSIETIATVGYGVMHPVTLYTHLLSIVEILFGVLAVPVATGMTIVKFARPTARVEFSRKAVVTTFDGAPVLMFRVANARSRGVLEAHVKITILRSLRTAEGMTMRRVVDLKLLRDSNPMFVLSWTMIHPLDEDSPLHGLSPKDWIDEDLVITCIITGIDEVSSGNVHARYTYYAEDIAPGQTFQDIISIRADGTVVLDFTRFHDTIPAPTQAEEKATGVAPKP